MRKLIFCLVLIFPLGAAAQKPEIGVMLGSAMYNGDLGNYFQTGVLHPAAGMFVSYNLKVPVAFRINFMYGNVSTDDKKYPSRNLKFKSQIFEYSFQVQYYFTQQLKGRRNFSVHRKIGIGDFPFSTYIFAGLGRFNFNPRGQTREGAWVDLKPMSTEGEGILPTRSNYNLTTTCIPFGLGIKHSPVRGFALGFELGFRKTFTDYLDDASLTYIDTKILETRLGQQAAYLSNPSLDPAYTQPDPVHNSAIARGNPKNKDAYLFAVFSFYYDFSSVHRARKFRI